MDQIGKDGPRGRSGVHGAAALPGSPGRACRRENARACASIAVEPAAARLALDVTDAESVRGVAEAAGTVDVLVNNAAEIAIGPLESIAFAEIRRLYEINVFGTLRVIQAFAAGMRARRAGTIMNVSSS